MAQILLVEDHAHQRALYKQELEDEGYTVDAAEAGAQALELYRQRKPDLVIADILLPGMDGIEFMQRVLALDPETPIIVHSAFSSPGCEFITWFAQAYIVKSGDLTPLKEAVRTALQKQPARRSLAPV